MPVSVPNYLTTNAAGDVVALFPGGVQIFSSVSVTPPDDRTVRWVHESDGALTARISSRALGSDESTLTLETVGPHGSEHAEIILDAHESLPQQNTGLYVTTSAGEAVAPFGPLYLCTGAWRSDWMQLLVQGGPGRRVRINWGTTGPLFINGGQVTNTTAIPTGFFGSGATLAFVGFAPWFEDSGYFNPCIVGGIAPSTSMSALDGLHGAHGPGNLAGTGWLAIGVGP